MKNNQLFQNYLNYLNTGKNSIFRVDIHLIGGCNFRCIMCDNWKKKVELNFDLNSLKRYILILKKSYNCNYIRFHGQEPSLYKDLEDLIFFTKKLGIKVAIKTNGWLINDLRLAKLLLSGLDELYLSIDGPDSKTHDKIRGMEGSFNKNVDLIVKSRKINPDLKIYINSVVTKLNFKKLDLMVDFGERYNIDRVSFVLLNDKNRKDIENINLSKKDFYNFFSSQVINIYKKAEYYNISIDFSPFLSDLTGKDNCFIINELENNSIKYKYEIESFYRGDYGKYFYDKYGCFGPIDHASINFNGDMYGCCVIERDSINSIGNILNNDLHTLWKSEKYVKYRVRSNELCSYSSKCASNYYTRKTLFKDIYLDEKLYDKNEPISYYRYLKEFQNEGDDIKNIIKLNKLKSIVLYFYENLEFYKDLCKKNGLKRSDFDIPYIFSEFIKKIPILNKDILIKNYEEVKKINIGENVLHGKTSGTSGKRLEFTYALDFKRYIKQIAIFSKEFGFTFNDYYFTLTPINCNQTNINSLVEPNYVKKVYLPVTNKFDFDKNYFLQVSLVLKENSDIKFLHTDSKYLLYLIQGFDKYSLNLPNLKGISISYSYTNRSLKEYISGRLKCDVYDNYGCSEIGPISVDIQDRKEVFGDNIILEEDEGELIITDLDNYLFPFIRYKNGDLCNLEGNLISINGKSEQQINGKTLKNIDDFIYYFSKKIITYQFLKDNFYYISNSTINEVKLKYEMKTFFDKEFKINIIDSDNFMLIGECSKFKMINN